MSFEKDFLENAIEQRKQEVFNYQVNIDNYRNLIAEQKENPDPDLANFVVHVENMLGENIIEQKKSKAILRALEKTMEEYALR